MYTPSEVEAQRRFFDRHLKGIRNGIDDEPRVTVVVRRGAEVVQRHGSDYPLPGTQALRCALDPAAKTIGPAATNTPAPAGALSGAPAGARAGSGAAT